MLRRRILLIEDEESISEPLAVALEREGFDVVIAATAADGRELFRTRGPDLVLLDVMLPDGDGKDVLREIRSASRTPVIMVTARGEEQRRSAGRRDPHGARQARGQVWGRARVRDGGAGGDGRT